MLANIDSPAGTNPNSLRRPELLAPAGDWDCAKAAVENGADAIYFGLERFNARMRAQNFTEADLPALMEFLHRRGVKGYLTLNTLIFPKELEAADRYLKTTIAAGVDAVIVQDIGICRLIRHLSPDFPIHASTQMTITSAAGVEFAKSLGCQLVVLARECSLQEIRQIQKQSSDRQVSLPLEVFVHGALCVAYSGQCLTSEALGGRSANRGECAQACRMPYDLIVDRKVKDLGDRKYLLSPQDLAGIDVLPELLQAGVHCLKIEGRLKAPEYVANITRIYRQAIDRVVNTPGTSEPLAVTPEAKQRERYELEMSFSRGLYTGWFRGIHNQELVHGRFGKKRGVYLGTVARVSCELGHEFVALVTEAPIEPGDGIVFDRGRPDTKEEGGRVYTVEARGQEVILTFGQGAINWQRVGAGDRIWKTSDPALEKQVRRSFASEHPQFQRPIQIEIHGCIGQSLVAIAHDEIGHIVQVESSIPLVEAHAKPMTTERLQEQFGRLGNTPFCLGGLENYLSDPAILPVSELNRMRRDIVSQLEELRSRPKLWQIDPTSKLEDLLPKCDNGNLETPQLIVLTRNLQQLQAAIAAGIETLYCEFEDPRAYKKAVELGRSDRAVPNRTIWVAPPRIAKPGENWILQQVRASNADGYLVRNYDCLEFFEGDRCIGDFSLNVANSLTADYFKQRFSLERLTASYDLNIGQLADLLRTCPPNWFEITIHQHMPMFHMEHCVFCAFLSTGKDYTDCGRPCEQHEVKLRDRAGAEHVLRADAGCRNTVFNGTAQTGAEYVQDLMAMGARHFRIEFTHESPEQVQQTVKCYQQLLHGEITGAQLWQKLKLQNQLGVTRGSF
ncbi:U32 family peptidase [Pseudanabaena sp. PCC 6802]|uniref:U32 family peptidase n=1 Tax=Pseudanabaena sp. PCC 6802 TaxID=118173 RepID=UPI0003491EF4